MIPLLMTNHSETGICSFQVFTYEKPYFLAYAILEHLVVNVTLLAISAVFTWKTIMHIMASARNLARHGDVKGKHGKLKPIFLLVIPVIVRVMCWSPLQVALVLSLCGLSISPEVMIWLLMVVQPMNAVVNPYLFTLRTLRK